MFSLNVFELLTRVSPQGGRGLGSVDRSVLFRVVAQVEGQGLVEFPVVTVLTSGASLARD